MWWSNPDNPPSFSDVLGALAKAAAKDTSQVFEELEGMLRKEMVYYKESNLVVSMEDHPPSLPDGSPAPPEELTVSTNEKYRKHLCAWIHNVINHFQLDWKVAPYAMSYYDRFVAKFPNAYDQTLMIVACLSVGVKLTSVKAMKFQHLSHMSRCNFTEQELIHAETKVLEALQWKMHPPTAVEFLQRFMLLIFHNLPARLLTQLYQQADFIWNELFLNADPEFRDFSPSCQAVAILTYCACCHLEQANPYQELVQKGIYLDYKDCLECSEFLWDLMDPVGFRDGDVVSADYHQEPEKAGSRTGSPVGPALKVKTTSWTD